MKKSLFYFLGFGGLALSQLSFSQDCTAPQSVIGVASLVGRIFDGTKIECDNGNAFSMSQKYVCKGNQYVHEPKEDEILTTRENDPRYVVSVLHEVKGRVVLTEVSYESAQAYHDKQKAIESTDANFVRMSDRSIMFYSSEAPDKDAWLVSTWFLTADDKVKGYKNYADETTTCHGVNP